VDVAVFDTSSLASFSLSNRVSLAGSASHTTIYFAGERLMFAIRCVVSRLLRILAPEEANAPEHLPLELVTWWLRRLMEAASVPCNRQSHRTYRVH
jgi:hypothetical protein